MQLPQNKKFTSLFTTFIHHLWNSPPFTTFPLANILLYDERCLIRVQHIRYCTSCAKLCAFSLPVIAARVRIARTRACVARMARAEPDFWARFPRVRDRVVGVFVVGVHAQEGSKGSSNKPTRQALATVLLRLSATCMALCLWSVFTHLASAQLCSALCSPPTPYYRINYRQASNGIQNR